jgi:hypothetical protein
LIQPDARAVFSKMTVYSDFVDRLLLNPDLHRKLTPTEPLGWDLPEKIRTASDETISGGREIADVKNFALLRGALLNAADALDAAHRIFQDDPGDIASYWHGVMHRREGDFDNARYWFRRAGRLPISDKMHAAAAQVSATMAKQPTWDAYLFTGMCEQVKFGDTDAVKECVELQRVEFEQLFDYCWRRSVRLEA